MPISRPPRSLAFRARPKRGLVGLTPLIDVVFILLIFFMVVSSFTEWRTITLSSPFASGGRNQGVAGAVLVEVRSKGDVRLSGETMRLDAIDDRLRSLLDEAPDQRFIVKTAEGVALQELVDVLDRLSAAGADDIAFSHAEKSE